MGRLSSQLLCGSNEQGEVSEMILLSLDKKLSFFSVSQNQLPEGSTCGTSRLLGDIPGDSSLVGVGLR